MTIKYYPVASATDDSYLGTFDNGKSGIYMIENFCNGHIYIGQSHNLRARKSSHLSGLRRNEHNNPYLQNAYDFYGERNFRFTVLEYCNVDLDTREQYWIDMLNPEYNIIMDINENKSFWTWSNSKTLFDDDYPSPSCNFRFRPSWHSWVYGGERNPLILEVRS